jgi:hypothetical protein
MNIGELAKFRGGVSVDTISELTSASGVTVDSVLLKDGNVTASASGTVTTTYIQAADAQGLSFKENGGTEVLAVSDAGAMTAGPTSGLTAAHTLRAGQNVVIDVLTTSASDPTIKFTSVSTNRGYIQATGDGAFNFQTSGGVYNASCTTGGHWTWGQSGVSSTATNIIYGYRADGNDPGALRIDNASTATDANGLASPVVQINKYSNDSSTSNNFIVFTINSRNIGSGRIAANGSGAAAFQTYSDRRVKENIIPLSGELKNILALNPVEFDYKDVPDRKISSGHQIGFIAQEMELVYPDAVNYLGETEQIKSITGWSKTEARLVKAIQELSAKLDEANARISALEEK